MPSETLKTAHELTDALHDNTDALRAVRNRFRYVVVFVIAVALVLAVSIKSRYDTRVSSCFRDNEVRSGLLHLADVIEGNLNLPLSPGEQEFLDTMRDTFAVRNCDTPWI